MLFEARLFPYRAVAIILISFSTAITAQTSKVSTPSPSTRNTQENPDWQVFRDDVHGVVVRFPANWTRENAEEARFTGKDGNLLIDASGGYAPEDICEGYGHHKLQPLGPHPKVRRFSISGQPACSALPSADDRSFHGYVGTVVIQYPAPVRIQGSFYWNVVLYGDLDHILAIAKTLKFIRRKHIPPPPPGAVNGATVDLDFENDGGSDSSGPEGGRDADDRL